MTSVECEKEGSQNGPLVSVILPFHDRVGSIGRAIDSILAQSWRPLEIIAIDDGSSDGSHDIVAAYGNAVTLIRQPQSGAYRARNLGIAHARGALIAFADSDDAWLPHKLEVQVPLFADPAVGLVFGDVAHVAEARVGAIRTGTTSFDVAPPGRGDPLRDMAFRNFMPTCAVVVRREALAGIGGFREDVRLSADYLAWFRIARNWTFAHVPEVVAEYTVHAGGISFDLGRSLQARLQLFGSERQVETDPRVQTALDHLLFNLRLQWWLAKVRVRTRSVASPPAFLHVDTAHMSLCRSLRWTTAFFRDQLSVRIRRGLRMMRRS